jgi:hypothetical protein
VNFHHGKHRYAVSLLAAPATREVTRLEQAAAQTLEAAAMKGGPAKPKIPWSLLTYLSRGLKL